MTTSLLRVIVQLAPKQKAGLSRVAKARHLSLTAIVREAVDAYLATLEKKP